MKVTFLRHAESLFNVYGISEKDCDLSETGKQQAAALTGAYDIVICSPMFRTRETLRLSKLHGNYVGFCEDCREYKQDICDFKAEEDETVKETEAELEKRIHNFKKWMWQFRKEGQRILVVTHRDFVLHITGGKHSLDNAEMVEWDISRDNNMS